MQRLLAAAFLIISMFAPLGINDAIAAGYHSCDVYGKANHCHARWDHASKTCTC